MHLDPRDPAAQAFIADHMADWPLDSFEEACAQSGALDCEFCGRWFSKEADFVSGPSDRICDECDADPDNDHVDSHREWGTWG